MLDVSIVIGNPKPNSRTGRIAEMVADEVLAGVEARKRVIDLAQHADELFRWPSQEMADSTSRLTAIRGVRVSHAWPTYTGLLKAFWTAIRERPSHGRSDHDLAGLAIPWPPRRTGFRC